MVISEWIKIRGKGCNFDNSKTNLYVDYSNIFLEAWARFSLEENGEKKLVSIIGVKKEVGGIKNDYKYGGYVFQRNPSEKLIYSKENNIDSNCSIYDVALMCDIRAIELGNELNSICCIIEGEYV